MEESSKIEGRKEVPIRHFGIDFSQIVVNRKLELLQENSNSNVDKSVLLDDFEMADYLMKINEKYGLEIEQ